MSTLSKIALSLSFAIAQTAFAAAVDEPLTPESDLSSYAAPEAPPPTPPPAEPRVARPKPSGPEPAVGWSRGKRAPIYVNVMVLGQGFDEDTGNRLTTRKTTRLEGAGGLFRLGGVIGEHNRLGLRVQSFVRPTRKILRSEALQPGTQAPWGSVMFAFAGPEYLYTTASGLYLGGSLGFAGVATHDRVDWNGDATCTCDCDDGGGELERASVGGAALVSIGYEWRIAKWFAVNAEAFAGAYRGVDDNERAMGGRVFGIGVGAGF